MLYSRFAKVVARTGKLLKAELPHLQEIHGFTELPYLKKLHSSIAPTLNVKDNLSKYFVNKEEFTTDLVKLIKDKKLINNIENSEISLLMVSIEDYNYVIC